MKLLRDSKTGEPLTYNKSKHWTIADKRGNSILVPIGTKLVTVGDLKNQTGTKGERPQLYCEECGAEFSANAGDYWNAPKDHVFTCCEQPMQLVFRRTIHIPA
jgi:hypothetical protein